MVTTLRDILEQECGRLPYCGRYLVAVQVVWRESDPGNGDNTSGYTGAGKW